MKWKVAFNTSRQKWLYCAIPFYTDINKAHREMNRRSINAHYYEYCVVEYNVNLEGKEFTI